MTPLVAEKQVARTDDIVRIANGERLPDVADLIARARRVQAAWAARSVKERIAVLRRARRLIPKYAARFDGLVHPDRRAPGETLGAEVLPLADSFRFLERCAARILKPRRLGGRFRPMWLQGVKSEVYREPYGVILIIGPCNYPLFLTGAQAIQALVAGNAAVMKPGEGGWEVTRLFADMLIEAGLDPDLAPVLPESAEAGSRAIDAGVDKVILTGSARTGAVVLAQLAPRLIPATMELSGCDPVVVRADADLDRVTRAIRFAFRLNHGETCIAPHRVFVHHSVAADLQQRLENMARELEDYPVRTRAARAAVGLIQDAVQHGARVLAGRILPDQQGITPTVITDATPEMNLMQADLFAPVVAVVPVQSDDEAVRLASQCPYALGATVFGSERASRALADRINAGGVTINDAIAPTADPRVPFGGRARSGFGVTRGGEGLLDVTTVKVVTIRQGGLLWHLDSPGPSDAEFFDIYLRATNASTWREWIRSSYALARVMLRRVREPAKPQTPGT